MKNPNTTKSLNVIGQRIRMTKEASACTSPRRPREGVIVDVLPDYFFMVKFDGYKHPQQVPGEQWELA